MIYSVFQILHHIAPSSSHNKGPALQLSTLLCLPLHNLLLRLIIQEIRALNRQTDGRTVAESRSLFVKIIFWHLGCTGPYVRAGDQAASSKLLGVSSVLPGKFCVVTLN
jgi:hypothetical protein